MYWPSNVTVCGFAWRPECLDWLKTVPKHIYSLVLCQRFQTYSLQRFLHCSATPLIIKLARYAKLATVRQTNKLTHTKIGRVFVVVAGDIAPPTVEWVEHARLARRRRPCEPPCRTSTARRCADWREQRVFVCSRLCVTAGLRRRHRRRLYEATTSCGLSSVPVSMRDVAVMGAPSSHSALSGPIETCEYYIQIIWTIFRTVLCIETHTLTARSLPSSAYHRHEHHRRECLRFAWRRRWLLGSMRAHRHAVGYPRYTCAFRVRMCVCADIRVGIHNNIHTRLIINSVTQLFAIIEFGFRFYAYLKVRQDGGWLACVGSLHSDICASSATHMYISL